MKLPSKRYQTGKLFRYPVENQTFWNIKIETTSDIYFLLLEDWKPGMNTLVWNLTHKKVERTRRWVLDRSEEI